MTNVTRMKRSEIPAMFGIRLLYQARPAGGANERRRFIRFLAGRGGNVLAARRPCTAARRCGESHSRSRRSCESRWRKSPREAALEAEAGVRPQRRIDHSASGDLEAGGPRRRLVPRGGRNRSTAIRASRPCSGKRALYYRVRAGGDPGRERLRASLARPVGTSPGFATSRRWAKKAGVLKEITPEVRARLSSASEVRPM